MKNNFKYISLFILVSSLFVGCQKDDYSLGDLSGPSNVVISTEIVGVDSANPNGDGSGRVNITVMADNAMSYKIGYNDINDLTTAIDYNVLPGGTTVKKFTAPGLNTYRITVIAYGRGGTSSIATKDVTVQSNFAPTPEIITSLTNNASKTWVVDKDSPGHFGVGPWDGEVTPIWYSATPNEKAACCNCFYTASFTFTKLPNSYSIQVNTPDGAFTKTGALSSITGIPASGDEGCYSYPGATAPFSFVPSSSVVPASAPSTKTSILLSGNTTFIGYGAMQKEYEIMTISATSMYLRVRGTEAGNAWYLKLIPAP